MILDTNAVSALNAKDPGLKTLIVGSRTLFVTTITLGEYIHGVRASRFRGLLESWIRESLLVKADILTPDLSTVEHYADIRTELKAAGTPVPANDLWIAALARQHDEIIVSRDRHFDKVEGLVRKEW